MLKELGLTMAFWGEALATLVHVWNQCPPAALDNATSYELWHGCKPNVSHLQVWGSTAYVHIQKNKHSALCHPGGAPDPIGDQDSEPNAPLAVPQPLLDAPKIPPPAPKPVQSPIGISTCLP